MEGVSAAANVIAVIQLAGSVLKICGGYLREVKNARDDITALQQTVEDLRTISLRMRELLEDTRSTEIASSSSLINSVSGCMSELSTLEKVIDPGKGKDLMRRFGIRAFKWPLHRSEVDKIIRNLERFKSSFTLLLQVDQTALLTGVASSTASIHWNLSLDRLPVARGAEFDSYMDQHEVGCLPGTRTQLLRQVRQWARSPQGEYIFWLNGMAGTGKSTISRTVAQTFKEAHILGASFFFKRGEGDRGSALKLFPTITRQLVARVPQLIPSVQKALDNEPDITGKSLPEQFDKLLLQPIMSLKLSDDPPPTVVLVIDALDECECDEDIRMVLQLFPRLRNSKALRFRIFLTSRPEIGIRLGFSKVAIGEYEDLVLHDIPEPEVAHDISLFLEHRLSAIRAVHSLPVDWPGETDTHSLVKLSIPLFIFAATACRILEDPRWDPVDGLAEILARRNDGSQFDGTYLPVLNRLLKGQTKLQERQLVRDFQEVVGAVALLESPLSVVALSKLLGATESRIGRRLNSLPSVLNVPNDRAQPVRLFHLSFRDFLLDLETRGKTPFWIDAKEVHQNLATQCLRVCEGLRKNICELNDGTERSAIDSQTIIKYIPPELQYCCRYWTHHLTQSKDPASGKDRAFLFLRKHFLHWMEAMSILGYANEVVQRLTSLQTLIDDDNDTEMSEFLHDAKRFVLANRQIADKVPLQIYCSGLLFAPGRTIFSREFKTELPEWACQLPQAEETWSATLEVLEGHSDDVNSVAFSPVGPLLASGSYNGTVLLWDSDTGKLVHTLKCHSEEVKSVSFSPDGRVLASGSCGKVGKVRLWDSVTGELLQTLECHCGQVNSVSFSPDGQVLASGSNDKTIRLWDLRTGTLQQTLEGHTNWVTSIAFSPNGRLLASGSLDETVRLWKTAPCALQLILKGHSYSVSSIAFSPNGRLVASASGDMTVRLWDVATGTLQLSLRSYSNVSSVAFSPDGRLLASGHLGLVHNPVRFWDVSTGTLLRTLIGHSGMVKSVAFSPDGRLLASGSIDSTIRLWDTVVSISQQTGEDNSYVVKLAVFSPDGRLLASASSDNKVRIWETATSHLQLTLEGHSQEVSAITFSSDGRLVASGSFDKSVRLWGTTVGTLLHNLIGHADSVESVTFSADGQLLASRSEDNTVRLWNTTGGTLQQVLVGHSGWIKSAALTPGGQLLATGSTDKKVRRRAMPIAFSSDRRLLAVGGVDDSVRLQVTATGRTQQVLEGHTGELLSVVFSPDGRLLASSSTDRTVRVWNTATGSLLGTIHALIFGSLAFSPDGRQLVSKHRYHPVRFWDVTTGAPQKDPKSNSSGFGSITFSPDRQLLAPGSGTRLLRLLDTSTGDLQEFSGSLYPVTSVSFSPDGRLLASGSADMTVRVWDIITGTLQWSSEGHSEIVVSVAYSPDGRLLASGSRDGTILVWDTAKSTLRHTLTAAGSVWSVTHLDFGEDSSTLRTRLQSFNLQARHVNCTPNSLPVTLNISPQSQWIMLNGANSLWLPYGYRCVAIHERMLALLHSSGRLSFILVRE